MQQEPALGAARVRTRAEVEVSASTIRERWGKFNQLADSFLDAASLYEDPLSLIEALHEFFAKALRVKSCQTILQSFRGESYRLFRGTPEVRPEMIQEWPGDAVVFRWYSCTYVDHLFLGGPTQRVGERQVADNARRLFASYCPSLCFPLMAGIEQIGLLLIGDDFTQEELPNEVIERLCLLVRNVNLTLTRLGLLDDVQTTGRLPRGLAHDFQGLLTPIAAFVQLALEEKSTPEILKDLGAVASRNISAVQEYIQAARPSVKGISPVFKPGQLEDVALRAFDLASPQFTARQVQLEWISGAAQTHLLMDETLLLRLVMNLLANALAASQPGSRVTLQLLKLKRSTATGNWMRIRVADQGKGFVADRLAQLLNTPFGLRENRDSDKGFGIGLAICRRIARMHGGAINLSSIEGQGAVAEVDFPQKEYL